MRNHESEHSRSLVPLSALGIFVIASSFAFTKRRAKEIKKRDGYTCIDCGAFTSLHASHHDHSKDNQDYNSMDNGDTLCKDCHGDYHQVTEGCNGLTKSQNRWAIKMLRRK